jgi:outer membrane protein assembly factor BamB
MATVSLGMGSTERRIILCAPSASRTARPVYSPFALPRSFAILLLVLLSACGGRVAPHPLLFPLTAQWTASLEDFVVSPLAADSRQVYVATRDGALTAVDVATGDVTWRVRDLGGPPAATDGRVVVRGPTGTVYSLRPRDGALRWKVDTGVAGPLPATLDGDRLYIAGQGLVALGAADGERLWTRSVAAEITAPPVATASRLLVGDARGVLRCLDRATGTELWSQPTGGAILAPPLVDARRGRIYLGTTDQRIVELTLDRGKRGWEWPVGADVQAGGLLLPDRVVFASFDDVLYALARGGNLAWRAPLPSRPLGAPSLIRGYVLVVCRENEIVGFAAADGRSSGSLRTTAEIQTPLLAAGSRIVVGLRDRTVIAYALPETPAVPTPPEPPPAVEDRDAEG